MELYKSGVSNMLRVKVLCVVRLSSMSRETRESRLASSRYYYHYQLTTTRLAAVTPCPA